MLSDRIRPGVDRGKMLWSKQEILYSKPKIITCALLIQKLAQASKPTLN
jgi:hypothetical protein